MKSGLRKWDSEEMETDSLVDNVCIEKEKTKEDTLTMF